MKNFILNISDDKLLELLLSSFTYKSILKSKPIKVINLEKCINFDEVVRLIKQDINLFSLKVINDLIIAIYCLKKFKDNKLLYSYNSINIYHSNLLLLKLKMNNERSVSICFDIYTFKKSLSYNNIVKKDTIPFLESLSLSTILVIGFNYFTS